MGRTKKNRTRKLKQKLYRMKGCSKKGGTHLAYTGGETVPKPVQNPHLAFTSGNTNFSSGMKGGTCSSCNLMNGGGTCSSSNPLMKGGGCGCGMNMFKGGSGGTGSFVGKPWTSNPTTWPSQNTGNHYPLNTLKVDPLTSIKNTGSNPPFLYGGKRKNTRNTRKRRMQKGGVPQDMTNFGRQLQYGFSSFYNGLNGYSAPVNPLPWKGHFSK
jgi:hypothetical protein